MGFSSAGGKQGGTDVLGPSRADAGRIVSERSRDCAARFTVFALDTIAGLLVARDTGRKERMLGHLTGLLGSLPRGTWAGSKRPRMALQGLALGQQSLAALLERTHRGAQHLH